MHRALHPHVYGISITIHYHRELCIFTRSVDAVRASALPLFFLTALCALFCSAIGIISNMIKRIIFYQTHSALVARAHVFEFISIPHILSTCLFSPTRFHALLSHLCGGNATTWFIHAVMMMGWWWNVWSKIKCIASRRLFPTFKSKLFTKAFCNAWEMLQWNIVKLFSDKTKIKFKCTEHKKI